MPRRSMSVCTNPGCPNVTPSGRCDECRAERDRARGSATQRGYGPEHQAARRDWAPQVQAGRVDCWRCGQPIAPGQTWHLGHDDHDRTITRGPEHELCNLAAAGRASHRGDRPA